MSTHTETSIRTRHPGAPEWFLSWLEGFAATVVPEAPVVYGLGISTNIADAKPVWGVGSAVYHIGQSGVGEVIRLAEYWASSSVGSLKGVLEKGNLSIDSHAYMPQVLAGMSDGLCIVGRPNEEFEVDIATTIEEQSHVDLIFVVAPEGSTISLRESLVSQGPVVGRLVVILAEPDAKVLWVNEGGAGGGVVIRRLVADMGIRSLLSVHEAGQVDSLRYKSDTSAFLRGAGASAQLRRSVVVGSGVLADCFDEVRHEANHTTADIMAAGIVAGKGKLVYRGLVDARPGVVGMRGEQEAKFIAIDRSAEIDAIPALDIVGKEVASIHKLSIGFLSDTELFYPRMRGLSREEASRVLTESTLVAPMRDIGDSATLARVVHYQEVGLASLFTNTPLV